MDTPSEGLPPAPGSPDTETNVEGRRAQETPEGFGQLWRKVLDVRIETDEPAERVMSYWKDDLDALWPPGGRFHRPFRGVEEGEVAGIELGAAGATLSTGVLVVQSDTQSFTLRTPQGHMFAGSIHFSTIGEEGAVTARITLMFRASDPLYELGLLFGGHRVEELFWARMLRNLAAHYGQRPRVHLTKHRVDRGRHWRNATNIRYNAAIRTALQRLRRLLARVVPGRQGG